MSLNPESITIDSTSKLFEYEKIAREVDNCDDTEVLQNMLKCYVHVYLKQQETVSGFLKEFLPSLPSTLKMNRELKVGDTVRSLSSVVVQNRSDGKQ